jgi:hypothetical protein
MLAVAVPPVPPSFEVIGSVVFVQVPGAEPIMSIENVQLAPAASDAPARLTPPELGAAVIVPPPHEPVSPFG